MRPVTIQLVGTDSGDVSAPARMNYKQSTFSIGVGVEVTSGSGLYSVQQTFDAPTDFSDADDYNTNGQWFNVDDLDLNSKTANTRGVITTPCQAVRLIADSDTDISATATLIQGE